MGQILLTHTHTHTHTHTDTHTDIYIYVCVYVSVNVYVWMICIDEMETIELLLTAKFMDLAHLLDVYRGFLFSRKYTNNR